MKICLVVDDYMPNSIKVAAKMMHDLAVNLIEKGHEVSVITPSSSQKEKLDIILLDNVKIYKFKSGEIKNVSKVKRAINESLLSFRAWNSCQKHLKNDKHDLIIYYSPSIFFGPLINKLKNLWGAHSYLILRDLFPQWVIDNNMLKESSLITKYFRFFEQINYKNANTIGLMSQENLNWFNKKNHKYKNNTELLYNWSSNIPNKIKSNYRETLNLEEKIIFFYGGNMGHAQDMINLTKLAKRLSSIEKVHFLFAGTGDEVPLIEEYINKNNLSNITLIDSINQDEFKKLLSEIDIGLFTLNYNHKTHNFPGKLLGYMCESKPILGSINPNNDLKEIIEDNNAGYVSVNGEDEKLYENAIKLLDIKRRKELGVNSNHLLNSYFSVEAVIEKILSKS